MRFSKLISLIALIFLLSSCFHAKVSTNKTPSGKVIEKPWAHGFLFGLVPPSEINAAEKCENGVAKVETKLSFLNQLASFITFNLYTPMYIEVQCAEASAMSSIDKKGEYNVIEIPENSTNEEIVGSVGKAAERSKETGQPVYMNFK